MKNTKHKLRHFYVWLVGLSSGVGALLFEYNMKTCITCKQSKPFSEFNKDRSKKDGIRNYCKSCQRSYSQSDKGKVVHHRGQRKYRKTEKGKASEKRFAARYPNRIKAKWAVNHEIGAGKMQKAFFFKCKRCPEQAQQYHHPSYEPERRLDVIPVCRKCHREIHCNSR